MALPPVWVRAVNEMSQSEMYEELRKIREDIDDRKFWLGHTIVQEKEVTDKLRWDISEIEDLEEMREYLLKLVF